MSATDFSERNRELRTVSSAFRDRLCIAHDWTAQANTMVQEGDELGTFQFDDGSSEPILSPTTGLLMRLFRPPVGTLGGRPSQVLALFDEPTAAAVLESATRAVAMTRAPKKRSSRRAPARKPASRKGGGQRGQRRRGR